MALPFLQKKKIAGVIISHRKPDGAGIQESHTEGEDPALEACAEDIIRAIHDKDAKHLALALRSAFECLESEPHKEGPHTNDYDEQNEKAGQE